MKFWGNWNSPPATSWDLDPQQHHADQTGTEKLPQELKTLIAEGKAVDENPSIVVVDARSSARFSGEAAEPRPGLRGGHMPGAKNLPITDLLDPDNKVRFKSKEELRQIIQDAGIPLPLSPDTSKIISSCGSGVTACALLTAFDILGEDSSQAYLYDGAWCQWGGQSDTPIVKDWCWNEQTFYISFLFNEGLADQFK